MKFGNSKNFEQSYNLQAAVDADSMLIVGAYPTQKCNDKEELKNCVKSIPEETEKEHPAVKVICATERIPPVFNARTWKHRY